LRNRAARREDLAELLRREAEHVADEERDSRDQKRILNAALRPVATLVATVDANPNTMAGGKPRARCEDASIMAPLPIPTLMPANAGESGTNEIASRLNAAMTAPVQFEMIDLVNPAAPPPHAKNDAQAMNVTHTGIGITVAVR
jgi:hypothetical protein